MSWETEAIGAKQQLETAKKLRDMAIQAPQGQMVGNVFVAPHWTQHLAHALRNLDVDRREQEALDRLEGADRQQNLATIQAMNAAGLEAPQALLAQAQEKPIQPGMIDRFSAFLRGEEAKPTQPAAIQQNIAKNLTPEQKEAALMQLSFVNPEAAQAIAKITEKGHKLNYEKVPVGFVPTETGEIKPMQIAGGNGSTYMDYQLGLARQKEGIVNPVEQHSMNVSDAHLAIANANLNRQLLKDQEERQEKALGQRVPKEQISAAMENESAIRDIDKAIDAVQKNPNAFGVKNYLPGDVVQRYDAGGNDPRARVGDIGAVKYHDMTGAAGTAKDDKRFSPFIPKATDSPEKILENLRLMREKFVDTENQRRNVFSPENGYRQHFGQQRITGQQGPTAQPPASSGTSSNIDDLVNKYK